MISLPYLHYLLQRTVASSQFRHGEGCRNAEGGHEDILIFRLAFRELLEESQCKAPVGFGQLPHARVGWPRDCLRYLWCLGSRFFLIWDVRVAVYTRRLQGHIFGLQAAYVSKGGGEDPENSYTHHPLHSHLDRCEDVWRCLDIQHKYVSVEVLWIKLIN